MKKSQLIAGAVVATGLMFSTASQAGGLVGGFGVSHDDFILVKTLASDGSQQSGQIFFLIVRRDDDTEHIL